jgi:EmrB/QacA subfamily drug resistance transporter
MLKMTETNRKWWILAAGITSLSMIFVDQTALPVALPAIQQEFNIGGVMLQWIINAYLLMLATFVILGGKLGDKYGHKHIFILGQALFILASISCALGNSGLWLAISRGIQGIGGAMMIPATQTIIFNAFGSSERGRAIGLYVGSSSVFLIIGPLLGGLLTEHLSWRWIFWINLPIAILGICLCLRAVTRDRKSQENPQKLDLLGFALVAIGLFLLVFVMMEAPNHGWLTYFVITCIAISATSLFAFIQLEKRKAHPFVDLSIFKNRDYSLSCLIMLCQQSVGIIVIFWIIFLQYVIPVSASKAGAIVIAAQAPITFMAPLAGRIVDRYGPRFAATLGICLMITSFIWIMGFAWARNYWWLIPGFFIYGTAATLPMFGIMSLALHNIGLEKRGVASGVLNSARLLGNSIGLALLSSTIIEIYHSHLSHLLSKLGGYLSQLNIKDVEGILASAQAPAAKASLLHLSPTEATQVHHLAVESYIFSFSCIMAVAIAISFIGLWLARKLPGKRQN